MGTLVSILIIAVAVLLILVVLVQNSKGGGLAAGTSANQVMGVKKTADFLEKLTWGLAIVLVTLSLVSKMTVTKVSTTESGESELKDRVENATPAAPMPKGGAPSAGDSVK